MSKALQNLHYGTCLTIDSFVTRSASTCIRIFVEFPFECKLLHFYKDWTSIDYFIAHFLRCFNRPLPSSKNPHFQNDARCTKFLEKMSFICMRMKNDFYIKD